MSFMRHSTYALVLLFLLLQSCTPPTKVPVEVLWYRQNDPARSHCLFIFLPGRGDRGMDFARKNFIEAVRKKAFPADILAADLHFGYYREGTALMRLKDDIVDPAKEEGYAHLWLVGVSAGGLASLIHAFKNPGDITGMVLLGPFLGEDEIIQEIESAGGIRRWYPGDIRDDDYQRKLWRGIQNYARSDTRSPVIYLGYGKSDRLSHSHDLLSTALPPERVFTIEGGHDWGTWKKLFDGILERFEQDSPPCDKKP